MFYKSSQLFHFERPSLIYTKRWCHPCRFHFQQGKWKWITILSLRVLKFKAEVHFLLLQTQFHAAVRPPLPAVAGPLLPTLGRVQLQWSGQLPPGWQELRKQLGISFFLGIHTQRLLFTGTTHPSHTYRTNAQKSKREPADGNPVPHRAPSLGISAGLLSSISEQESTPGNHREAAQETRQHSRWTRGPPESQWSQRATKAPNY